MRRNLPIKKATVGGFIHHLFDRKSCSYCPFQEYPRHGDISIADFWGIQNIDPSQTDGKGTSLVFINNEKGESFYKEISESLIASTKIDVKHDDIPNQVKASRPVHKLRDRFLSLTAHSTFAASMEKVFSKRFDVGQVCNYKAGNFGGSLTQYALYHVLEDMGFSTLMIERPLNTKGIKRASTALDRLYLKSPYPEYALAPQLEDKEAMRTLNRKCDAFVVGSDQLFQYSLFVEMGQFTTLDWVEDSKKKIAYAASFGHGHIWGEKDVLDEMAYFMKKFDAFSVREKRGASIAKNEFGVNAEPVLDPVFLCDRRHYDKLINVVKRESPEHYVGSYILDPSKDNRNIIRTAMKTLSLPCEVVSELSHNERYEAPLGDLNVVHLTIEERLKSIANCDFFVTDSFHGTCFAIIMQKPFVAIKNNKRGGDRFDSLLNFLGLKDRLIESFSDLENRSDLFEPIDYTQVYQILDSGRNRSRTWLHNALTAPGKKTISDYDMMRRLMAVQNQKIDELTKQIRLLTSPMSFTSDILEYLNILSGIVEKHIIFIAVKDTPGAAIGEDIAKKLMALGLKENLKGKHWHSYIAIIEDGNVFFETISTGNEPSSICASLSGMTVEVTSKVFQNGNEAKIILNGENHAINKRGLNIVVYNKQSKIVSDAVAFDTHTNQYTCTRA